MKKHYLLLSCFLMLGLFNAQAQMSVLFVDDSDDTFSNAEALHAAIEAVGFDADYFDAGNVETGPTEADMNEYDMVVWHTSTDGGELFLWNQLDEDNTELKNYLDGGGKLWLTGHDFLFDRYIPQYTFAAGEFVYDYLGISSYDGQSFADDGGLGVTVINPVDNPPIADLNDFVSMFATYWYADVVSLRDEAQSVYVMGGDGYPLAGETAGVYYDNATFQVLTYLFDISLAADTELLNTNVLAVLNHFSGLLSSTDNIQNSQLDTKLFPNPSTGELSLQLELDHAADVTVSVLDVHGRNMTGVLVTQKLSKGQNTISLQLDETLINGYYYLKIGLDEQVLMRPFVLQK